MFNVGTLHSPSIYWNNTITIHSWMSVVESGCEFRHAIPVVAYNVSFVCRPRLFHFKWSRQSKHQVGRAMQKRVFGYMRTPNAQISLRIRAVWSGHLVSANRTIGYYRMYEWRVKHRWYFAHAQDYPNLHFVHFAHGRNEVTLGKHAYSNTCI